MRGQRIADLTVDDGEIGGCSAVTWCRAKIEKTEGSCEQRE